MQPVFLWELVRSYFVHGWAFAAVHALIGFLVVWSVRDFHRESRELGRWAPTAPAAASRGKKPIGQCSGVLTEFCRENERVAPAGLLVPLTDFTDRIDSIIEGMVGRLHDLTNLFLVVGIAGTIWSFFKVVIATGGNPPTSDLLIEGISTAFPVAFVGLILYTLSYLVLYWPEKNLRAAAAGATEKAWQERRRLVRTQVAALDEALAPLRDLKTTLADVMTRVLASLNEGLATTHKSAADQLEALRLAVTRVDAAVRQVTDGVAQLNSSASKIDTLLTDIPTVLSGLHQLQGRHGDLLGDLTNTTAQVRTEFVQTQQIWGAVLGSLRGLMGEFERLPPRIEASTKASLDSVAGQVPKIFDRGSEQLQEKVVGIARELEGKVAASSEDLRGAAQGLRNVAEGSEAMFGRSVEQALRRLKEAATEEMPKLEQVFAMRFPDSLDRFDQLAGRLNSLADRLQALQDAYAKLTGRLAIVTGEDQRRQEFDELRGAMSGMQNDLRGIAQSTGSAARLLERIARDGSQMRRGAWFPFDNVLARLRRLVLRE